MSVTKITFGTWNIHQWTNIAKQINVQSVSKALQQTPTDIICFQEATRFAAIHHNKTVDAIGTIKNVNKYAHCSSVENGWGVAFLSKYRIFKTYKITERLKIFIIQPFIDQVKKPSQLIGLICVHFHYRSEMTRKREFHQIQSYIQKNEELSKYLRTIPFVFLGDFNALNEQDYTRKQWNQIKSVRKRNKWELPTSQLMVNILNGKLLGQFHDCLHIASEKNKSVETCRFHTRIDYILVNNLFLEMFDIIDYKHLHPKISDHLMVRMECEIKGNIKVK